MTRGAESIGLRNAYTAPLNLVQIELLRRVRESEDISVQRALMVSIAGVALRVTPAEADTEPAA